MKASLSSLRHYLVLTSLYYAYHKQCVFRIVIIDTFQRESTFSSELFTWNTHLHLIRCHSCQASVTTTKSQFAIPRQIPPPHILNKSLVNSRCLQFLKLSHIIFSTSFLSLENTLPDIQKVHFIIWEKFHHFPLLIEKDPQFNSFMNRQLCEFNEWPHTDTLHPS